jgi:hypothetical protein
MSERASAPSFGFGKSTRATHEHRYLSKDHAKHLPNDGPGPGRYEPTAGEKTPAYLFARANRFPGSEPGKRSELSPGPGQHNVPSSGLGMQRSSSNRSMPSFSVGKATREGLEKNVPMLSLGKHSPGPSAYAITQPALGRQSSSRRKTAPSASFSKSERFVTARAPAPGAYPTQSTFGKQVEGIHASEPHAPFGKSTRATQARVFISAEHSKTTAAPFDSPGPQAYFTNSGGRQHESTRSAGFGKSDRWGLRARPELSSPGPGAYSS